MLHKKYGAGHKYHLGIFDKSNNVLKKYKKKAKAKYGFDQKEMQVRVPFPYLCTFTCIHVLLMFCLRQTGMIIILLFQYERDVKEKQTKLDDYHQEHLRVVGIFS